MTEEAILELTTKILKEKLVPSICVFYWDMAHKKNSINERFK
ncbi:MAG: hypothetical protein Q8J68_01215 [Methanolobus sp.]|nr:hypothetical protein [Methanolobus sp.]MDP2215901.1 hypothetical protein [Methanolobus sp.]